MNEPYEHALSQVYSYSTSYLHDDDNQNAEIETPKRDFSNPWAM